MQGRWILIFGGNGHNELRYKLAKSILVPPRRINEIVLGKRVITANTALRLSKVLAILCSFEMGLQDEYEVRAARAEIQEQFEASRADRGIIISYELGKVETTSSRPWGSIHSSMDG